MNCIVIEDQAPAQRLLRRYISDIDYLSLKEVFFTANDALSYIEKEEIDLIFLDIHLPEYSGIDLIKKIDIKPFIIITTAFQNYAIEGYELDVADYLLKPISFDRFKKATAKVFDLYNLKQSANNNKSNIDKTILVKNGHDQIKLFYNDIFYIKSEGDYTMLYFKCKKQIFSYTLKWWIEQLPKEYFIQCHRSYIINRKYIKKICTSFVSLNDYEIPIGRKYKESFKNL